MADLDEAIDRVIGGLERKSRVLSEKERDIVAHHEIGHALVASSVPHADPVHKVTIIPRGVGALGATYQLPLEDRYLLTKSELEDRIAVLLGGRAAEEVVYGEISTGAHNDLERATEMARLMIVQYGMSEKLGPMTFGGRRAVHVPEGRRPPPGQGVQRRDRAGHRQRDARHHRQDLRSGAGPGEHPESRADARPRPNSSSGRRSRAIASASSSPVARPEDEDDDPREAQHRGLHDPGGPRGRRRPRRLGRGRGRLSQAPGPAPSSGRRRRARWCPRRCRCRRAASPRSRRTWGRPWSTSTRSPAARAAPRSRSSSATSSSGASSATRPNATSRPAASAPA